MSFFNNIDGRVKIAGLIAAGIIVATGAWYLGSPLIINNHVNETFPIAQTAMPIQAAAKQDSMNQDAIAMKKATAMPAAVMATTDTMEKADVMTKTTGAMMHSEAPSALSRGSFTLVDNIHKGVGNAAVYQLPDGRRVLRLEDFNVTNGPDLFVYLAGSAMPRSSNDLHSAGAFEVARLKGNIGDQNYELPADLDLAQFKSVVIYCKQFSVVFSTADLISAG